MLRRVSSKAVLITGCSSGIGRAAAEHLAARGWTIYATARRRETLAELERQGCRTLALDVTDEASMAAAVAAVEEAEGAVGVLVNNAGYSQNGAVESVPLERVRAQFETNVFGLVRMCQLVLPGHAPAGLGPDRQRLLDGRPLHLPRRRLLPRHQARRRGDLGRPALRGARLRRRRRAGRAGPDPHRLRRYGGARRGDEGAGDEGPYADFNRHVAQAHVSGYERGPLARLGGPPEAVARTIERALTARRPRARYTVTPSAKVMIAQRALLPDAAWDALMRSQFPQPGKR